VTCCFYIRLRLQLRFRFTHTNTRVVWGARARSFARHLWHSRPTQRAEHAQRHCNRRVCCSTLLTTASRERAHAHAHAHSRTHIRSHTKGVALDTCHPLRRWAQRRWRTPQECTRCSAKWCVVRVASAPLLHAHHVWPGGKAPRSHTHTYPSHTGCISFSSAVCAKCPLPPSLPHHMRASGTKLLVTCLTPTTATYALLKCTNSLPGTGRGERWANRC
jgi:hypothetical protein